ncbi:fragile histidine triad protein [Hesseltinella vesiculosa]|uniref:Bis(5'-adenosyl)-triphosphatase n=1 Tax=Hesseltinella vesiculosa TaxID=101127 RepID=A0A1X2GNL8_9FUNG|nr:fragile histidine triad protein [Hesseltinella vesiculosa]
MKSMFMFGPNVIPDSQIFYQSLHCFGLVNLKPIIPGHVLVVSKRLVPRLNELRPEEAADLMISARNISSVIEKYYKGTSVTFALQDGPDAGQTVPHVHMHIIPRRTEDYENNDDIYSDLNKFEYRKQGVDHEERKPRSELAMKLEADQLRVLFGK